MKIKILAIFLLFFYSAFAQVSDVKEFLTIQNVSVIGILIVIIGTLSWYIRTLLNDAKYLVKTHKEELAAKDVLIEEKHQYIMNVLKETIGSFDSVEGILKTIKENGNINIAKLLADHKEHLDKLHSIETAVLISNAKRKADE